VIEWLERFAAARGIHYDWFETGAPDTLAAAIRPETRLVWLETPANPTWAITDIAAASAIAHAAGARLAVDSTCATPVLTRPLELGADLVCHAATKYLGGHSDVLAGALITREEDAFWQRIADHRRLGGAMLGAMDAYLLIRGLRTLYLRVERQCANAQAVAEFLAGYPVVERVLYPGLAEHPGHAVATRQMQGGYGGMLSFQPCGDARAAIDVVRRCRVWKPATSLGGTESLIEHRRSSEGDIRTTTPDNLIRLSTGIEAAADLIGDLERALAG
jgi:cystathionine gamma-synthase